MGTVFVTNTNDFPHEDRYDGESYFFAPQEPVAVSEEAARHMFGRGLVDKENALQRLGWATRYNPELKRLEENPDGVRQLARFVFEEAEVIPRGRLAMPSPVDELPIA